MPRVLVVLNPMAGSADENVREVIERHLAEHGWECDVHETREHEDLGVVTREAVEAGVDLCVSAGGDGTVAGVAGGLAHTDVPLGIVPVGTGNVLAQELGVPADTAGALDLLTGDHDVADLDAMNVGERYFLLNVSAGIGSLSMRDTEREAKRRFGLLAYIVTTLRILIGYQPRRFTVTVDGEARRLRASEVMVANSAAIGNPGVRLGANVYLDDGRLDLCVIRARTILDYIGLAWSVLARQQERSRQVSCIPVRERVRIDARHRLPVEADGEIIGETPVEVRFVPAALRVIVPRERPHHEAPREPRTEAMEGAVAPPPAGPRR